MYVDAKVTVWHRIEIPEKDAKEKVIKILKDSHFKLWNHYNCYYETLVNTEREVTTEENNGQPTVELYNDDNELIWENSSD